MNFKTSLVMVLGLGLWAGTVRAQNQTAPYLLLSSARPSSSAEAALDNPSSSCGKVALAELARLLKGEPFDADPILQTPTPPEGFSLAKLARLAEANGLSLSAVEWAGQGELPVPCLIHWSFGHYAVIVAGDGQRYRVLDHLWGLRWFSLDEIKEQTSGNLLVPEAWLKTHVSSYRPLSSEEASLILGRVSPRFPDGTNSTPNPDNDGPCNGGPDAGGGGPAGDPNNSSPATPPGQTGGGTGCASCTGGEATPGGTGRHQQCPDCSQTGMAYWRVSEPYLNLWIYDEPLGYQPAIGGKASFWLAYKQRNIDPVVPTYGFGPGWNCPWVTFIDQITVNIARLFVPGGGNRTYVGGLHDFYSNTHAQRLGNNSTDTITTIYPNYTDLIAAYYPLENTVYTNGWVTNTLPNNLVGYALSYPDGKVEIFDQLETNGVGVSTFIRAYRTQVIWPDGTTNRFIYVGAGAGVRLQQMIDAEGRTNTLSYTNLSYTRLVTSVQDPFGRTAYMTYDNTGVLTNITDPENISSGFHYSPTTGWITGMTTPYGNTTFQLENHSGLDTTNLVTMAVEITEPDGGQELYMYRANSQFLDGTTNYVPLIPNAFSGSQVPGSTPVGNLEGVTSLDNTAMYARNTFHWDKRHLAACSTSDYHQFTTNDYNRAHLKHWLMSGDPYINYEVKGVISMEREPSPDAAATSPGQFTWYDYFAKQQGPQTPGTNSLADTAVQMLPNGDEWYYLYGVNEWGLPTSRTEVYSDAGGAHTRQATYAYASNDQDLIQVVGPDMVTTASLSYTNHLVLTYTNAVGDVTSMNYNTNQQLTSLKTPTLLVITNLYYTSGMYSNWLQSTIVNGVATNSYSYTNGLVYQHTNGLGFVSTFNWDGLKRPKSVSDSRGTISLAYSNLDLASIGDRLNNTNSFGHDLMRRLTSFTNALQRVTQFSYCNCGALSSAQDALGKQTQFFYDVSGHLTNVVYADGRSVTNFYNLLHELTNSADNFGFSVKLYYNDQRLLTAATNSLGLGVSFAYDIKDRLTNVVNADGLALGFAYDNLDRLTSRAYPNGGVEQFNYSPFGLTNYIDPLTNKTFYAYDNAYRLLSVTNANNEVLRFTYNALGEMLTLADGKNQTNTWNYYPFGLVTNKVDAASNVVFYLQFDANNRLTNRWTPAKGNTYYTNDAVGNVLAITHPLSPSISYKYDALNRLTNMTDALGVTVFSYTAAGQLQGETGPWAGDTISYTYNKARLRSGLTLSQPNATAWVQSFLYDPALRLTNTTAPSGVFQAAYGTGAAGSPAFGVAGLTLPNGAVITNYFDAFNRLVQTVLQGTNGTLNSHGYGYNVGNQRTSQTNVFGDYVNFAYDKIGQLTSALAYESNATARLNEQSSYGYDAAHNLIGRTNNDLQQAFIVNSLNELSNVTHNATITVSGTTTSPATNVTVNSLTAAQYADGTFAKSGLSLGNGTNTYTAIGKDSLGRLDTNIVTVYLPSPASYTNDLNGNLLFDGLKAYDYDDENQLVRITVTNTWKTELTYDGLMRRRIRRESVWQNGVWVQTNEVHYVYDGPVVVQERDLNNVPVTTYSRAGAWLLGMSQPSLVNPQHYFYHTDGNGNITALVNGQQNLAARAGYDPFGNLLFKIGPMANANLYWFSSQEYHSQSDSLLYLHRVYIPSLDRWLNRDPIGEWGGLNLFRFVGNDPVNKADNDGDSEHNTVSNVTAPTGTSWNADYTAGLMPSQPWTSWGVPAVPPEPYSPPPPNQNGSISAPTPNPFTQEGLLFGSDESPTSPAGQLFIQMNGDLVRNFLIPAVAGSLPGLVKCVPKVAAGGGSTPLWRAVNPDELADIQNLGQFRNLGSAEGKYFSTTAEGAASYAKQAVQGFGDPPYTLIQTEVPYNLLSPSTLVDKNVPAIVLPNNVLRGLKPQVLDYFPVPPR